MIDERILKAEERAVYGLRSLYRRFGYMQYKMGKFEEYDLYAKNKSFLVSDEIITFTDGSGKLMALRPDVTLSIVKDAKSLAGSVQKFYYNEYVYRMSRGTREFKEIMQTGLECVGDISAYHICEVVDLAIKSLRFIDEDYLLDISHAGLVAALLDCHIDSSLQSAALECIRTKNPDGVRCLSGITEKGAELARLLTVDYGDFSSARRALDAYLCDEPTQKAMDAFGALYAALDALGLCGKINIDFSIANDMRYYSDVVFKGYIKGIPTSVLSGGQYDKLMQKIGRVSGAIGFAVYLDVLERFRQAKSEYDTDIVLLQGEGDAPAALVRAVETLSAEGASVAVMQRVPNGYLYRRAYRLVGGEVKAL